MALLLPLVGGLSLHADSDCRNAASPIAFNVGIPHGGLDHPRELLQDLKDGLPDLGIQPPCEGQPLHINLAIGSPYQILDWLGQGMVDAAIAPALTHHLLNLDSIVVRRVELPSSMQEILTPKRYFHSSAWVRHEQGRWKNDPANSTNLDDFLAAIWTRAVRTPWPGKEWEEHGQAARLPPGICGEGSKGGSSEPESTGTPREPLHLRLAMPSHLSTAGFLEPMERSLSWLDQQVSESMKTADGSQAGENVLRECFWREFFAHSCFYFSPEKLTSDQALCPAWDDSHRFTEIRIAATEATEATDSGAGHQDLFLVQKRVAEDLFSKVEQDDPGKILPLPKTRELLATAHAESLPSPFRALAHNEPFYDTRTFAFSIRETLDLLELHQRSAPTPTPSLALVLPGGGVKAAYQSQLIDHLYSGHYLYNSQVQKDEGLPVEYVVGTSGGALLGYFVARLGDEASWNLPHLLWTDPENNGESLSNENLFAKGDLLRYASVVTVVVLFCAVLWVVTLPFWNPFGRQPKQSGSPRSAFRARLLLPLGLILGAAPLLVRWVGNETAAEHTPEFEGLLFAVMVSLAMYADQCLIHRHSGTSATSQTPSGALHSLFAAGTFCVVVPLASRAFKMPEATEEAVNDFWLIQEISFLGALVILTSAALLIYWAAGSRWHRDQWSRIAKAAGVAVLVLAANFVLVRGGGQHPSAPRWMASADRQQYLLVGLAAAIFTYAVIRAIQGLRRGSPYEGAGDLWSRVPFALSRVPVALRVSAAWLLKSLLAGVLGFLFLDFCRPTAPYFTTSEYLGPLWEASRLEVKVGTLLLMLGLLLLVLASVFWLGRQVDHYHHEGSQQFLDAQLFVLGGICLASYSLVWLTGRGTGSWDLFELSCSFWVALVVCGLLVSLGVILWGVLAGRCTAATRPSSQASRYHRVARHLCELLRVLAAEHPNGHFPRRRFVRVACLAVLGLVWWNGVLAPGIYGNRKARHHIEKLEDRFHQNQRQERSFQTRFLAPANDLEESGTHYVLVVPPGIECSQVREPRGSDTEWHRFRAHPNAEELRDINDLCTDLDLSDDNSRKTLESFIFASGSPFPVFPAHAVDLDLSKNRRRVKLLVDGGYSNLIPVEAAARVKASHMLIVHSSNPLPCEPRSESWWRHLAGPLIRGTLHLPGFLYNRSQAGDRFSRQDAFVTSLAPRCRDSWPTLTDFQEVNHLLARANEDLRERIGRVESWGPVRFQDSFPHQTGAAGQSASAIPP